MDKLFKSMEQDLNGQKYRPDTVQFLKAVLILFEDTFTQEQLDYWTDDGYVVFTQDSDLSIEEWNHNRKELDKGYRAIPFYAVASLEMQEKVESYVREYHEDYAGVIFVREMADYLPEIPIEGLPIPLGFVTNDSEASVGFDAAQLWIHYQEDDPWANTLPMLAAMVYELKECMKKTKRGALRWDQEDTEAN